MGWWIIAFAIVLFIVVFKTESIWWVLAVVAVAIVVVIGTMWIGDTFHLRHFKSFGKDLLYVVLNGTGVVAYGFIKNMMG